MGADGTFNGKGGGGNIWPFKLEFWVVFASLPGSNDLAAEARAQRWAPRVATRSKKRAAYWATP